MEVTKQREKNESSPDGSNQKVIKKKGKAVADNKNVKSDQKSKTTEE